MFLKKRLKSYFTGWIYGGFNIMTAAGNAEKVEKGKQILLWATIGLIVIFTPVKYRAVANLR